MRITGLIARDYVRRHPGITMPQAFRALRSGASSGPSRFDGYISIMRTATAAYNASKNRATAQALKTAIAIGQAGTHQTSRELGLGINTQDIRRVKAVRFSVAQPALNDAFSAGLVGRDKGGLVSDLKALASTPAITLPLAILTAGVSLAGTAASTASTAAGAGASVASTSAQIAGITTATESAQIVAGQALANSIGAGLTGTAAQVSAVEAIAAAGIPATQAAAAIGYVPALAAGTAASGGIIGEALTAVKNNVGSPVKREITRISEQISKLDIVDTGEIVAKAGAAAGGGILSAIKTAPAAQTVPTVSTVPTVPTVPTKTWMMAASFALMLLN